MDWCHTTGFVIFSLGFVALSLLVSFWVPFMNESEKKDKDKDMVRAGTLSLAMFACAFVFGVASSALNDASVLWGCG